MNQLEKIIATITIAALPACLAVKNGYQGPRKHGAAPVNSSSVSAVNSKTSAAYVASGTAAVYTATVAPVESTYK